MSAPSLPPISLGCSLFGRQSSESSFLLSVPFSVCGTLLAGGWLEPSPALQIIQAWCLFRAYIISSSWFEFFSLLNIFGY